MKTLTPIAIFFISINLGYAAPGDSLIGGQTEPSSAYAALVAREMPTSLSGAGGALPTNGQINAVAIHSSGIGLIVGESDTASPATYPYAAMVRRDGSLSLLGLQHHKSGGAISSVDVNRHEFGIIGGNIGGTAYAAYVHPIDNVVEILGLNTDSLYSVAINSEGLSIVGGGSSAPYAALITGPYDLQQIQIPPNFLQITSVAINDSNEWIIAGGDMNGSPCAAIGTYPNPIPQYTVSGLTTDKIFTCEIAINNAGTAILGTIPPSSATLGYAYFITPNGIANELIRIKGSVLSVDINPSGTGIIGGQTFKNKMFAIFFPPNTGSPVVVKLNGREGIINAVAIDDTGIALIGGVQILTNSSTPSSATFTAVVAPDGTVTELAAVPIEASNLGIVSVAIPISGENLAFGPGQKHKILTPAVPNSVGPYSGHIQTHLAATWALNTRIQMQSFTNWPNPKNAAHLKKTDDRKLVSYTSAHSEDPPEPNFSEKLISWEEPVETTPREKPIQKPHCLEKGEMPCSKNTLWAAPFGNYVHLSASGSTPSITNAIAGALLGLDHQSPRLLFGGAVGYAYNYMHYGQSQGHGKLQEEIASLYWCGRGDHFWLNLTMWGGLYQIRNVRHSLFSLATSKAHIHGWILDPHAELAFPIQVSPSVSLELFGMADWVNNWQQRYTEHGPSGLNLKMHALHNSLLRSEAGLRFYEELYFNWGSILFKEKLSYINQKPFQVDPTTTSFVGSVASFTVISASTKMENLLGTEFQISFLPRCAKSVYGSLHFQGEWGSSLNSYFANLEIGKNF